MVLFTVCHRMSWYFALLCAMAGHVTSVTSSHAVGTPATGMQGKFHATIVFEQDLYDAGAEAEETAVFLRFVFDR